MNDWDDTMNDWDQFTDPCLWNLVQSAKRAQKSTSNTKKAKMKKTTATIRKADTINVHKDQDYIDSLTGVTKIAVVAISELVNQGKADFLFLRDEEVKNFWDKHLAKIVAIREEKEREQREKEMRKAALAKLTPEEKKLLGIR